MTTTITTTTADPAARDLRIEGFVEKFEGASWEFVNVHLIEINDALSKRNQARSEPIIPELVERYTRDAIDGAKFPPLLLANDGARIYTLDGNNRRAALMAACIEFWPAYIVTASATVFDLMARTANTTNGAPLTPAEQRVLIHDLHTRGTFTRAQIASLAGVTESVATRIITAEKARKRATSERHAAKLSDNTLVNIGGLMPLEAFDLLVAAVATGAVSSEEARSINSKARKIDTDEARIDFILDQTKPRVRARKGSVKNDANKLNVATGSIIAINPAAIGLLVKPGDREAVKAKIAAAIAHLNKIKAGL